MKLLDQGSFEKIGELSTSNSLPKNYVQTARQHALDGCYVLGLGHRYDELLFFSSISYIMTFIGLGYPHSCMQDALSDDFWLT